MSVFRIDHVVIRVQDLAGACRAYEALGFTVTPGGEHPGLGSHNALIPFADDTYLELIAFRPRSSAMAAGSAAVSPVLRRVRPWEDAPEGLVDFALVPAEIAVAMQSAREHGLSLEGPLPGGRRRLDGQQVAWQFGVPATFDLPFLCADVTPRSLRVPEGSARQHANGVLGLARLVVAVRDLEASRERYRALLGTAAASSANMAIVGARTADIAIDDTILTLAEPEGENSKITTRLDTRGEGPFQLWLKSSRGVEKILDPTRTCGANIVVQ